MTSTAVTIMIGTKPWRYIFLIIPAVISILHLTTLHFMEIVLLPLTITESTSSVTGSAGTKKYCTKKDNPCHVAGVLYLIRFNNDTRHHYLFTAFFFANKYRFEDFYKNLGDCCFYSHISLESHCKDRKPPWDKALLLTIN